MLKKIVLSLAFTALVPSFALAADVAGADYAKINGVSLGGGAVVGGGLDGAGFFDIGFNLYNKGSFSIRNNIQIFGGGASTGDVSGYGLAGIRERITFGNTYFVTSTFAVRGYGGIDVALNYYFEPASTPLSIEPRGFGGVEFLIKKQSGSFSSVFVEAGGSGIVSLGNIPSGVKKGSAFISLGGSIYF